MKRIYVYQNNRNENKFIELKRTDCGHFYYRQFMKWKTDNGVVLNHLVYSKKTKTGLWLKTTKWFVLQVLKSDYSLVGVKTV